MKEVKRDKKVPDFKDLWIFQKNISINEITFPDGEATEAKWVTIKQFINMYNNKEIVPKNFCGFVLAFATAITPNVPSTALAPKLAVAEKHIS